MSENEWMSESSIASIVQAKVPAYNDHPLCLMEEAKSVLVPLILFSTEFFRSNIKSYFPLAWCSSWRSFWSFSVALFTAFSWITGWKGENRKVLSISPPKALFFLGWDSKGTEVEKKRNRTACDFFWSTADERSSARISELNPSQISVRSSLFFNFSRRTLSFFSSTAFSRSVFLFSWTKRWRDIMGHKNLPLSGVCFTQRFKSNYVSDSLQLIKGSSIPLNTSAQYNTPQSPIIGQCP